MIGTTAPGAKFDIGGSSESIRLSGGAAQTFMTFYNGSTRKGYVGTGTGGTDMIFNVDSGAVVLQGGNVGIGTTAPSAVLEVAGNVKFGCPTGMVDSGAGFCIDASDSTEGSAGIALTNCANAAKGLCNFREYCTAYMRGIGSLGGATQYRVPGFVWFASGSGNWLSATGSLSSACTGVGVNPAGNPQAYRCCRYRG